MLRNKWIATLLSMLLLATIAAAKSGGKQDAIDHLRTPRSCGLSQQIFRIVAETLDSRAAIVPGAPTRFTLKGSRTGDCPGPWYASFYNRTCSNPERGPALRHDTILWDVWDLNPASSGGYFLEMSTKDDRQYRCPASMAPTVASSCQSAGVTMLPKTSATWDLVPVADDPGAFNIILRGRTKGCRRYLAAAATCSTAILSLAATDDASGLQRWIVEQEGVLSPPPASPAQAPSPALPSPPVASPPAASPPSPQP